MPTIAISEENYQRLQAFGAVDETAMTLDQRLAFALDEALEYEEEHGKLPHDNDERSRVIGEHDDARRASWHDEAAPASPTPRKTSWERLDAL